MPKNTLKPEAFLAEIGILCTVSEDCVVYKEALLDAKAELRELRAKHQKKINHLRTRLFESKEKLRNSQKEISLYVNEGVLKSIRKASGRSLKTIGDDLGMSVPHIHNVEQGMQHPSIELLKYYWNMLLSFQDDGTGPDAPQPHPDAGYKPKDDPRRY